MCGCGNNKTITIKPSTRAGKKVIPRIKKTTIKKCSCGFSLIKEGYYDRVTKTRVTKYTCSNKKCKYYKK